MRRRSRSSTRFTRPSPVMDKTGAQVVDLFDALAQSLKGTDMSETTKAEKWKQHFEAEQAIKRHWKARKKARAAILKSFEERWQPKLSAIIEWIDDEVVAELNLEEPKDEDSG